MSVVCCGRDGAWQEHDRVMSVCFYGQLFRDNFLGAFWCAVQKSVAVFWGEGGEGLGLKRLS